MWRFLPAVVAVYSLLAVGAFAHLGSPDVFSEGKVGPYPARITIRMPAVVPGRAAIEVQSPDPSPLEVSFLPLYARTAVKNAPPADPAARVFGSPGLYRGELWLMSVGAYGIEVRIRGAQGEGAIQIPVNSVATHQLGMPPLLGGILAALAASLVFGVVMVVRAAAAESILPPGAPLASGDHRRGRIAAGVSAFVVVLALAGGWFWWKAEEREFRRHLRDGPWPDLAATVQLEDGQRNLHLVLGAKEFGPAQSIQLLTDHGKLLHLFLIRRGSRDVFAHLHPVRTGGQEFTVALPPLPGGDYEIFCDLTLSTSALSSTATATVHLDDAPSAANSASESRADPDDSWAGGTPAGDVCRLNGGLVVMWRPHPPLQAGRDASLDFEIRDAAGNAVPLEPYMGMPCHAAILRQDGRVFSHLHPSGNYSMAAQSYFQDKVRREAGPSAGDSPETDHSKMGHAMSNPPATSSLSIPYEFPTPGHYRLWLQFKTGNSVRTAVFDADVGDSPN